MERYYDFFKNSEKEEKNFQIGAEFEHFIVTKESHRSISFEEKYGIEEILKIMAKNPKWKKNYHQKHLIGLESKLANISLEPAGQFEISINPQKCIKKIENIYLDIVTELVEILERYNYLLVTLPYHPQTKIDEINMIPKMRYEKMYKYFKKTGKYAHNMMKGTASIQIAIDYSSEKDFVEKMRLSYQLSPLIALLFDNSLYFEGEKYKKNILRQIIWQNCDDDRCGLIPNLFSSNFGYNSYVDYMFNISPIFFLDEANKIYETGDSLREIYNKNFTKDQFDHSFSMHFPEVRARNYIEIRTADSLPYPLNFSLLHFIKTLFYDRKNFVRMKNIFSEISAEDIKSLIFDINKNGFKVKYGSKDLSFYLNQILNILKDRLNSNNKKYLRIVIDLLERKKSFKSTIFENYNSKEDIVNALSLNSTLRCKKCVNQ